MHRFVLSVRANAAPEIGLEIQTMSNKAAYLASAVVVLSEAVNLLHTASHAGQHVVSLAGWQLAYIAVVIYAAPAVAAVLLWSRYRLAGAWLLATSMAFLVLLESLTPTERAVFLLREVLQHLVAADTTASAIRCHTGQSRENNPAYVGGCAVPFNALQHFIYHSK
jgi:hypothetical protein